MSLCWLWLKSKMCQSSGCTTGSVWMFGGEKNSTVFSWCASERNRQNRPSRIGDFKRVEDGVCLFRPIGFVPVETQEKSLLQPSGDIILSVCVGLWQEITQHRNHVDNPLISGHRHLMPSQLKKKKSTPLYDKKSS